MIEETKIKVKDLIENISHYIYYDLNNVIIEGKEEEWEIQEILSNKIVVKNKKIEGLNEELEYDEVIEIKKVKNDLFPNLFDKNYKNDLKTKIVNIKVNNHSIFNNDNNTRNIYKININKILFYEVKLNINNKYLYIEILTENNNKIRIEYKLFEKIHIKIELNIEEIIREINKTLEEHINKNKFLTLIY